MVACSLELTVHHLIDFVDKFYLIRSSVYVSLMSSEPPRLAIILMHPFQYFENPVRLLRFVAKCNVMTCSNKSMITHTIVTSFFYSSRECVAG
jgi:hypothetical protein